MKNKRNKPQKAQAQQSSIQDSPTKQMTQWFAAVMREDVTAMDRVLAQGFDISTPFPNKLTPEISAFLEPQMLKAFEVLYMTNQMARTTTPAQIRDNFGNMQAIHIATSLNNTKSLEHLISKGADMSAQYIGGLTALHMASQENDGKALQILLKHNADLLVKSLDGAEPVHFAAQGRHVKNLRMLLNAGAYHDDILDQHTLDFLHK